MNLTVDIGNTFIKMAVFDGGQIVDTFRFVDVEEAIINYQLSIVNYIDKAILVSARAENAGFENFIRERAGQYIRFDGTVPVPIVNKYGTPETLGYDRLAAAVGAHTIYPHHPVLIVDFGTAITYDLITAAGEFMGGNISPGAQSRFRSLHDYTSTLPLRSLSEMVALTGDSTGSAIDGGVAMGILFETEGYMAAMKKDYSEIKTIFTGGDANYFAKRVKSTIFATSDLVFYGLNAILEYNAN